MKGIGYHIRFWMLSLVLFALALYFYFFSDQSLIDVNIYDTYYVMAYFDFVLLFGVWFALCGLGYWIVVKKGIKLYNLMQWTHTILSILPFILVPVLVYHKPDQLDYLSLVQGLFIVSLVGFALGQAVYFLNILISTLKQKK